MKNYFTLLSIALIILTLFSCSKEELIQEEEIPHSDELVGTWKIISITRIDCDDPANSGIVNIDYDCSNPNTGFCLESIYDFKPDNRLNLINTSISGGEESFSSVEVSYRFDGSNLYVCDDNGENCESNVTIDINANIITISPTNRDITALGCVLRSEFQRI